MSLTEIPVIEAAMQYSTTPLATPVGAGGVGIANSVLIDNENIAVGLVRKVRRIVFTNLDDALRTVRLANALTSVAAAGTAIAGAAALPKEVQLSNYEKFVMNPEKNGECVLKQLGVNAGARRLAAYISSAAVTLGVLIELDYYDDLDQA